MSYLIQAGHCEFELKTEICECCGMQFQTNFNRKRCSEKCTKTMKNKRHSENRRYNKIVNNN